MTSAQTLAQNIKLVIFDIDGVFTDGSLWFDNQGEFCKAFCVYDGLGVKLLHRAGIQTAVITARNLQAVEKRIRALGIDHYFFGVEDKRPAYKSLKETLGFNDSQIAYLGDDLPDLALIRQAGLGAVVCNANPFVQEFAKWKSTVAGGQGAVREFCEFILAAQNKLTALQTAYIEF